MSLALLMVVSAEGPDSVSELSRQVKLDMEKVSNHRARFDPHPARQPAALSTESYDTARAQSDVLKGLLKNLASSYRRYQLRSHRVLFRDEALAETWSELQKHISELLDRVDKTGPKNYSRVGIWDDLDKIYIAYENVIEQLDELARREARL